MPIEPGDRINLTPENAEVVATRLREFFGDSDNIIMVELHEYFLDADPIVGKRIKVIPPGIVVRRHDDTPSQIDLHFNSRWCALGTAEPPLVEFRRRMVIIHHNNHRDDSLTWIFVIPG